jgi:hypothetical protein
LDLKDLGLLQGLAATRNKCEYEHGFVLNPTPESEAVNRFLERVKAIVGRFCGELLLEKMLARYRFPVLPI